MMTAKNQPDHYKFAYMGQFSTGLKRLNWKYRRIHVIRFIGGVLAERNFDMIAYILKIVMLFDANSCFSPFHKQPNFVGSTG